jgi:hypothetical protein
VRRLAPPKDSPNIQFGEILVGSLFWNKKVPNCDRQTILAKALGRMTVYDSDGLGITQGASLAPLTSSRKNDAGKLSLCLYPIGS